MQLDGTILANGGAGFYGGAGGSVRLDTGLLTGVGTVEARGGNSTSSSSSSTGGGGGRIAVYADDPTGYLGSFVATGGRFDATRNVAGAGTLFIKETAAAFGG